MASGGYHPPANPAAVSGPGALSRRTDTPQPIMALPNAKYGEQKDLHQIQAGAPMQAPQVLPNTPPPGIQAKPTVPPPTPFGAPSAQPGVPVTSGAAAGPGPGPSALGLPPANDSRDQLKSQFAPILQALVAETQSQYATQAYKDSVAALLSLY